MIFKLRDGRYFDPTHLMHEGMSHGFPVEGQRFRAVVAREKAATKAGARYKRGRLKWPGIGKGPPTAVGGGDTAPIGGG